MNLNYYLGAVLSLPLLPIMYYQGKQIRATIPSLPEAKGLEGMVTVNQHSEHTLKVLTIGESTIAGVGVETHQEGFTGTLAQELATLLQVNIDWKVFARSGYTAQKVTAKLLPKITEDEADIIVIGLGANDAFHLHTPGKWRKDVQELIEALGSRFPTAFIVFCNMPPIKEFPAMTPLIKFTIGNLVEILGQELKKLVQSYDRVSYVSDVIIVQEWIEKLRLDVQKADFFSDGIHPSKLTYQTWAKEIASYIVHEAGIRTALQ